MVITSDGAFLDVISYDSVEMKTRRYMIFFYINLESTVSSRN
jgi:hypothetical protein